MDTPNNQAKVHTKANDSCLRKIGYDEPIFVLRAQDISADDAVQKWIDMNVGHLGFDHPKIRDAVATRDAMAAWPHRKVAD